MAKMTIEAWLAGDERRAFLYGRCEIDGAFDWSGSVYDGIWRVRLAETGELMEVEDKYVFVDVEEGPMPSQAWYDWFYEEGGEQPETVRAEMETLAAWSTDEDAPSCPSCGGETMPAYFGSELGWRQCSACENLFEQAVAS